MEGIFARDETESRSGSGLVGRIAKWATGLGQDSDEGEAPSQREATKRPFTREADRRRALYADIGDFLFKHDLDVTPLNFGLAHDYLTGNDLAIERAVAAVLRERGQLTNGAVEKLVADRQADTLTPETLSAMLDRVEENLAQLTDIASHSRTSAKDYGAALQEQVRGMTDTQKAEPVLAKLVSLTRSMLEKTREVESQMRESQKKTRLLQQNLEATRRAAEQDHLTGLPNRRAFEAKLKQVCIASRAQGEPLSIAFCDIDHFKSVNDTHGHDTGDRVLKYVADLLRRISNDSCHVARHGGEEFVMLFQGLTAAEACSIVDDAREDMAHRNLVNRTTGERMDRITFSAGVANVTDFDDPRRALKAADQALYLAKQHGRNRVYLAEG